MYIGQTLRNRYKIIKILGSGGFGDTYLAQDIDLPNHPLCVVKRLKRSPDPNILDTCKRLFDREAQVLYRLGNECEQIPKLFAHFEENGEFYLVQEFVDGENLSKEIYPGKQWSESEVVQLLEEILEVFTVIHGKDIIHRDIKPENLMRRHKDGKIVVIDFGAVKEIGTLLINTQGQTIPSVAIGTRIGTSGYMPNEQEAGQPKLCSDIYAIGILAIYALTGVNPRELAKDPRTGEVIWRNQANVSDKMADVITKMVRYHFNDRYHSALDAMDAITSLKPKPPSNKTSTSRREILKTLGWLGTGVGLTVVGGKLLQGNSEPGIESPLNSISSRSESEIKSPETSKNLSLQTFTFETVTVDPKGTITNRRQLDAQYFVEDLGNGITLEMVQIPPGTFTMGSPSKEAERSSNEGPQRQVTVRGFYIGKYTITQAQYEAIMGNNPARFKGAKRPVENVSWDDAVAFCRKLSQKTGRSYRLPSEAEWEYACRAGTTTPFYFGETITTDLVNYDGNHTYGSAPKGVYRKETSEVGKFPPNAFGLYDMHGNVWEWCQDDWYADYKGAPTDGSARLSGNNNQNKLVRGGSWYFSPAYCRSSFRNSNTRDGRYIYNGFRVVL
ncbi:bifunctional serine/threonine-protein kinase/formylglycine-generating enzyme family protein [Calothrix sp. NIES-3974]|uniref:bifunctional serine/threonine-protein kinase/formylglycine-generating enzyme family protein n=1 Tax=Calothrix sp. NIES-3974 TaxID=2005462 RepID=UPI000B5E1F9B|nr:bifunctional serine/threonine-protein kinase/formylglycine-generating enzyme family protein [Calothrix sp. NIES-3974]BAZ08029.1 serine/threonine protein kinase [Calothrix sp. NIES-3974]